MKIVIATDSFKGSLGTLEAARSMERGVRRVFADAHVTRIPIADGGEGTVGAMVEGLGGRFEFAHVTGPDGSPVRAKFGILQGGAAVLEMAAASGLTLVPSDRRDILTATTYGTGQLIRAALDLGCRRIYLGIGGSATNDGGTGMAQALGVRFLDGNGDELSPGGGALCSLARIDTSGIDPCIAQTELIVLCDVDNPLCGPQGASFVYGPQKGATPEHVRLLDDALAHLARVVRDQLGVDYSNTPGAGAAGGLGFGLLAFAGARLRPGIDVLLDAASFDDAAKNADLVLTGEGRIDGQSARGKVPVGVAARAKRFGVPVIAVAGSIGPGAAEVYAHGIDSIECAVCAPMDEQTAIQNAADLVADAAERALRAVRVGMAIPTRMAISAEGNALISD